MSGRHAIAGSKTPPQMSINVVDNVYSDVQYSGNPASASVTVQSNGQIAGTGAGTYTFRTGGSGSQIEIMFATISGTPTSGSVDVWLSGSTNKSLTVNRNTAGTKTWVGELIVRRASDGVELDRSDLTVSATVNLGEP